MTEHKDHEQLQEQQAGLNGEAPAADEAKKPETSGQGGVAVEQPTEQGSAAEASAPEPATEHEASGAAESTAAESTESSEAAAKPVEAPANVADEANNAQPPASTDMKAEPSKSDAGTSDAAAAEGEKPKRLDPAEREARRAAALAAKAAAQSEGAAPAGDGEKPKRLDPAEREARRAAALAAKAAAKAAAEGGGDGGEGAEPPPKEPSPKQPLLDKITALIRDQVASDAVEDQYINEADSHLPVVVVKNEHWLKTAKLLKQSLQLDYLINLSGVDYETYMEVVYHIESFQTGEEYCVKVRTDRESPSIPSVTSVWSTANWPEREVYDLLGIQFPGHPDLRRILMPDDWVGHPLRKDYEPLDPEV